MIDRRDVIDLLVLIFIKLLTHNIHNNIFWETIEVKLFLLNSIKLCRKRFCQFGSREKNCFSISTRIFSTSIRKSFFGSKKNQSVILKRTNVQFIVRIWSLRKEQKSGNKQLRYILPNVLHATHMLMKFGRLSFIKKMWERNYYCDGFFLLFFLFLFFALQALELLNTAQRHKTKTVIFLSPTHTALNDNFSDCFGLEMESATKQNKSQNINYYSLLPSNVW